MLCTMLTRSASHRLWMLALGACSMFALAAQVPSGLVASPPAKTAPPSATAPDQTQSKPPTAENPVPRAEGWWLNRHNNLILNRKPESTHMLFIGDSITQGWEQAGASIWERRYAPRGALNMGFSGDRTQHVLWRLKHNEVEGLHPKLAVVMIGTNNSNGEDNTAEEIAGGIKAIVASLAEKLPNTKVLLLAIFPRGETPNAQREKVAKASELASKVADGKTVHYLDIGSKLMNTDGTISKEIMPDFLHLSPKGYEIWADAIEDKVKELTGEVAAGGAPAQPR